MTNRIINDRNPSKQREMDPSNDNAADDVKEERKKEGLHLKMSKNNHI